MATSKVTVYFPCPMERVWHTVTDLTHTAWRSDLAKVEMIDETHFVEYTKNGYVTTFTIIDCKAPRFWAFTMENDNMYGSWEGTFESTNNGTRLTCKEVVTAKRWWMRPFVLGYLKRQQQRYLDDLQKELLQPETS